MNGIKLICRIFIIYLITINIVAFGLYGHDKSLAVRQEWRVSEKTLLTVAAAGGSVGALIGMHVFHHKTHKPAFYIGVPAMMGLQIVVLGWLWWRFCR